MNPESQIETICRASTGRVFGIVMMPVSEAALVSACQWLRKIHENRDEPLIKGWMRHDADPLPLLKELEEARMVNEVAKVGAVPLTEVEQCDSAAPDPIADRLKEAYNRGWRDGSNCLGGLL